MASNFRTFTITQARIGEPLQFQPALGSKELDELVDAYVLGSAPKQDKLSEVTLEFFNFAQVDIYTGILSRHYDVAVPSPTWASPLESQSSGFSPQMWTPSPASSMTFADSGYGSISMTPPTRTMGAPNRVVKKAKKDTKKAAEARLPGFSIMTKDGVDVTSSAGRGTKTKEQREHAHLMRIMKACDECKRKKIRCDPSHRRPAADMTRSTTSTSSSSSSSSWPNPSPPVPSLGHAHASPLPSFGNSIDDFVLFPEDSAAQWNPADLSLPEFDENFDLSHFNFDISGSLNDFNNTAFDFFDQPAMGHQPNLSTPPGSLGHDPFFADQYGLDQWASAQGGDSVAHTRPHPSSSQDSGHLNSSFSQSFQSQGGAQSTANFSQNGVALPSAEVDWSLLERDIVASPEPSPAQLLNSRERHNVERARNATTQQLVDSIPSESLEERDSSSTSPTLGATSGGSLEYWGLKNTHAFVAEATQALKSTPAAYQPICEELQRLRSALEAVQSSDTERTPVLQQAMISEIEMLTSQLQVLFSRIKKMLGTGRVVNERRNCLDPEFHPDFLLQDSAIQTRRLVSALCATINNLRTHNTGLGGSVATTNTPILISGNHHGDLSPTGRTKSHPQDAGYLNDGSHYSSSSSSSFNSPGQMTLFDIQQHFNKSTMSRLKDDVYQDGAMLHALPNTDGYATIAIATAVKQRYQLVTKPAFERLSRLAETTPGNDALEVSQALSIQEFTPTCADDLSSTPLDGAVRPVSRTTQDTPRQLPQQQQKFAAGEMHIIHSNPLPINTILEAALRILADRTPLRSQRALIAPGAQKDGSSGSESLADSGASSPGAIPGTILVNNVSRPTAFVSNAAASSILILASLVLMNYLQASAFMLPLAAILLAVPRPTATTVTIIALTFVLAQSLPLSTILSGLKCLVSAGILSAPLFKQSSKGSFGRALSSSKRTSSPFAAPKDSSMMSMFRDLSLGRRLTAV